MQPLFSAKLLKDNAILRIAEVRILFALFAEWGEELRLVGGAVRNALLGLPVHEFDFCTTMLPEEMQRRAAIASVRTIPTGIKHGTLTFLIGKMSFEITTLRQDIETDGRHATVRFGRDFLADALRRDFTINALSCDAAGNVYDYTNGINDLSIDAAPHAHGKNAKIRFIGEAAQRIREDYLRALRFLRFSATYSGGALDEAGLNAVISERAGLAQLSRERVRAEVFKLLAAKFALPVLEKAEKYGLISQILGQKADVVRLTALTNLAHEFGQELQPLTKLMALVLRDERDIPPLREAMKLTNFEQKQAKITSDALVKFTKTPEVSANSSAAGTGDFTTFTQNPCEMRHSARAILADSGAEIYSQALLLALADGGLAGHVAGQKAGDLSGQISGGLSDADRAFLHSLFALPEADPVPEFLLRGEHLLARGVQAGAEMGALLADLRLRWQAADFPEGLEAQLRLLKV